MLGVSMYIETLTNPQNLYCTVGTKIQEVEARHRTILVHLSG